MKYIDRNTLRLVSPGTHGGKLEKVFKNYPVNTGRKDEKGKDIYIDRFQHVGFKAVDVPDSWVEVEDNDPVAQPPANKVRALQDIDVEGDGVLVSTVVLIDKPADTQEVVDSRANQVKKDVRNENVKKITVEVDQLVFDGDENSQIRMARAAFLANDLDEVTQWKLANNGIVDVTARQLKEAARLAGLAQTAYWVA